MEDIRIKFEKMQSTTTDTKTEGKIILAVDSISGHQINLHYETITGNCPLRFGNRIHIWKGDGVKWGTDPYVTKDIPQDDQDGQIFMEGLNLGRNSFTIGYSVGPSPEQTASCVVITSESQEPEACKGASAELKMTSASDTAVSFSYKTIEGYTPKSHRAWVGIWERRRVPYPGNNPMGKTIIGYDSDSGYGTINQIELAKGQEYCIGLFLPDERKEGAACLAATYTFEY